METLSPERGSFGPVEISSNARSYSFRVTLLILPGVLFSGDLLKDQLSMEAEGLFISLRSSEYPAFAPAGVV
jgi:hypothetical protein